MKCLFLRAPCAPRRPQSPAPCRTFPRPLRVRARAHPQPLSMLTRRNNVPRDPAQGNNGPAEMVCLRARRSLPCTWHALSRAQARRDAPPHVQTHAQTGAPCKFGPVWNLVATLRREERFTSRLCPCRRRPCRPRLPGRPARTLSLLPQRKWCR